jgi:trk system potassium uptake protein TrkA
VTGPTLMDLPIKNGVLICCIVRDGKVITPSGRDRMEKGDIVIVVTTHKNVNDITYILEDSYRKKVGK